MDVTGLTVLIPGPYLPVCEDNRGDVVAMLSWSSYTDWQGAPTPRASKVLPRCCLELFCRSRYIPPRIEPLYMCVVFYLIYIRYVKLVICVHSRNSLPTLTPPHPPTPYTPPRHPSSNPPNSQYPHSPSPASAQQYYRSSASTRSSSPRHPEK